uniref:Reverse transcriptase domain-containing protein n=1 Tax=Cannabis sativa TaxID=3483 RepID=A0A803PHA9_CANSA
MASSSSNEGDWMSQYAHIQLEEEEEGVLLSDEQVEDDQAFDDRWCLVGKFLTNRSIDFDAMRHMMASLWQPGKGVYIKELDSNRYLFQFYHELDIETVIEGSPWTFNRMQLVFHRLKRGEDPRMVRLHELDMWVQLHDLKYGFMSDWVVRHAGNYIGKFVKSDSKNFIGKEEEDDHRTGSERHRSGAEAMDINGPGKLQGPPIIMSVLSWNCHGLGNPWAIQFIKDLVIQKQPKVVFLCETLSKSDVIEKVRLAIGFQGVFSVDCRGKSGGVALFWKDTDEVSLLGYGENFIDVVVTGNEGIQWRLIGLYGEPNRSLRKNTWEQIRSLKTKYTWPWCIIGDLNNVSSQSDKRGGNPYPNWLIDGFGSMLDDCRLFDMDLCGYPFTWERGRGTNSWIEVRIDRALVSQSWLDLFPLAKLLNLEVTTSDQCPLQLMLNNETKAVFKKQFRFENLWLREPGCLQIVKDTWEIFPGCSIMEKIKFCGEKLLIWGKDYSGNFKERIQSCKAEIKKWKRGRDDLSISKYQAAEANLQEVLMQKEIFWRQRSKQLWLREGDQNSKYFHAMATSRRRNNSIQKLKNNQGDWVDWQHNLSGLMIDYFSNLFSSSSPDIAEVTNAIPKLVSDAQANVMVEPIADDEVKKALFQMHPDKSPGPDGMTPGFFQKYWHLVGHDVISQVKEFFDTGFFSPVLNETNIVLIPKKKHPESMGDLRPISLCNVAYKIIAKVLANRIKVVLPSVISETQSAFIQGRLISDNIMVAFEVMHYLKRKRLGKTGTMALKLDMSKAYDRVEWSFLERMMTQLGFPWKMVALIMHCVSSVTYRITYGGNNMGPINPSRGIRQGDPLSPYLFLICAEGFSSLVKMFVQKQWLSGCRVARNAPIVSHMLFADDSYIFCKANETEAANVLRLLQLYEKASGQKINFEKSAVFFSNNIQDEMRAYLCGLLGMVAATNNSFYLGLPCTMGRNKNAILGFLKEKMIKRIQGWESKFLSKAGKEVLLKSVAQSLPNYAMSVFLLTKEICSSLEGLMARFWWKSQSKGATKGVSWVSWNKLCKHKDVGGLGFKSLREYNLAYLGKQGWRLITNEDSLVAKVYKARYYHRGNFLSAELGPNPSFIWRSILEAKDLLQAGLRRSICDGKNTSILNDPWLSGVDDHFVTTYHPNLVGRSVDSLLQLERRAWDVDLIRDMFNQHDMDLILSIQLSDAQRGDCWYWCKETNGVYSVRSAYKLLQQISGDWSSDGADVYWKRLWQLNVPAKVHHLVWRVISGTLPTKLQLSNQHVHVDLTCPMCNKAPESIPHVLFGFLEVVRSARTNLDTWKNAQTRVFTPLLNVNFSNGREHWVKPFLTKFKINVDGALFDAENRFGIGVIIRDGEAKMVEAFSKSKIGNVSPEVAEVIGVKEALSWIKQKDLSDVEIETDSVVVVQAINGSVQMPSQFGLLIQDCQSLISELNNVFVSFVKRSANRAVHCIARRSCFMSDCIYDEFSAPSDLLSIVRDDSFSS